MSTLPLSTLSSVVFSKQKQFFEIKRKDYHLQIDGEARMAFFDSWLEWQVHNITADISTLPAVAGTLLSNGDQIMPHVYSLFSSGISTHFENSEDWFITAWKKLMGQKNI